MNSIFSKQFSGYSLRLAPIVYRLIDDRSIIIICQHVLYLFTKRVGINKYLFSSLIDEKYITFNPLLHTGHYCVRMTKNLDF